MNLLVRPEVKSYPGDVYCPICTHTVHAEVLVGRKSAQVKPGQKCPRCSASLDAGYVLRQQQAA
jgi:uncharacterized Zn finger protein (UPF0148 family)